MLISEVRFLSDLQIRILAHLCTPCKEDYVQHLVAILNKQFHEENPQATTENSTEYPTVYESVSSLIRRHYIKTKPANPSKERGKNLLYISEKGLMAMIFLTREIEAGRINGKRFSPKVTMREYEKHSGPAQRYPDSCESLTIDQQKVLAKYSDVQWYYISKYYLENNWFDDNGIPIFDSLTHAQLEQVYKDICSELANDPLLDSIDVLDALRASNNSDAITREELLFLGKSLVRHYKE